MTMVAMREAVRQDLPGIIGLLADDALGAKREDFRNPLPECYFQAFEAINRDPNQRLMVADRDGVVVGTLQLTFIPNLTYQGGWRAQIEGVRIASDMRGEGLGARMVEDAVGQARDRGCIMIQLSCDKSREASRRFYEGLGFEATHEGMKLWFRGGRTG